FREEQFRHRTRAVVAPCELLPVRLPDQFVVLDWLDGVHRPATPRYLSLLVFVVVVAVVVAGSSCGPSLGFRATKQAAGLPRRPGEVPWWLVAADGAPRGVGAGRAACACRHRGESATKRQRPAWPGTNRRRARANRRPWHWPWLRRCDRSSGSCFLSR